MVNGFGLTAELLREDTHCCLGWVELVFHGHSFSKIKLQNVRFYSLNTEFSLQFADADETACEIAMKALEALFVANT